MTREPPESSASRSLHSDKNPYENILKDWTLEECYNESKINYWDFHIPNHADPKNLGHVDDFNFFSTLVDQLITPMRKAPVSQIEKENIPPVTEVVQNPVEDKVDFVKLSQTSKTGSNVDFTELSLFNSKKNRMSERARRRSQQITIEEDKPKRSGSIGPSSRLSSGSAKDQPTKALSRQNSFTRKSDSTGPSTNVNNSNVKHQPVRDLSRQNSFTKNDPVGLSSRLSNGNMKDRSSRNSLMRQNSFSRKTESTGPITRQRSLAMREKEKSEVKNPPQGPTAREKFILSRREAQKTVVKKEVAPQSRPIRRISITRPEARPGNQVKLANALKAPSAQEGESNKNTEKKFLSTPSSILRETRSSMLRAAKIRASIGTVSTVSTETPRRKTSLAGTPGKKISLVEPRGSALGVKREMSNVTERNPAQTAQKKIEPLTRPRNFDKTLRSYDPPTGHTPKKTLTLPIPFRSRRSTSQCRDVHPTLPPPVPRTPGRTSTTSSNLDHQERQELIRACVERLSSPRKLRCKGNISSTSDFASSKGSKA